MTIHGNKTHLQVAACAELLARIKQEAVLVAKLRRAIEQGAWTNAGILSGDYDSYQTKSSIEVPADCHIPDGYLYTALPTPRLRLRTHRDRVCFPRAGGGPGGTGDRV